jgi:hypothetical protein
MATTSVSGAAAMLHVNANTPATTVLPRDNTPDAGPRTRKRQKRIINAESEQHEYNTRTAAATAAACIQTEAPGTGPPLPPKQKEVSEPVFNRSDNGVGLRLIDVCALKKGLEHLECRKCSDKKIDNTFISFFAFHGKQLAKARKWKYKVPSPEESYELFKSTEKKTVVVRII